jgi:hypothetical protein
LKKVNRTFGDVTFLAAKPDLVPAESIFELPGFKGPHR